MVLVVDHTLVMVSRSHGAVPASSTMPPQMSTTSSPSSTTATDAPTSVPASRLADSVVATASKRGSQMPCNCAMRSSRRASGLQIFPRWPVSHTIGPTNGGSVAYPQAGRLANPTRYPG